MKNKIIFGLCLLTLGLSGYLIYDASTSGLSEAEAKSELNDLKNDYKFIKKDLENTIEKLHNSNELIIAQKEKIEFLLSKNEITEQELEIAKKLMQSISMSVLEEFQNRVAHLEEQKQKLTDESLITETKISSLNAKIENLEANRQKISEKYFVEKKASDKKTELLAYASGLSLSNFKLQGIKVRNSGKEVETDRASRINKLKVSFDINSNPLANTGNKEFYVVIKNSEGIAQKFENKPSGNFISDGKNIPFSDKISVHYDKTEGTPVEIEWTGTEFQKGEYIIEIYQNTEGNKFVKIGGATKKLD